MNKYTSERWLRQATQTQRDAAKAVDELQRAIILLRPLRDLPEPPEGREIKCTDFDFTFISLSSAMFTVVPHIRKEAVESLAILPHEYPQQTCQLSIGAAALREQHDKDVAKARKGLDRNEEEKSDDGTGG